MKGFLTASVLILAATFVTDANALLTRCEISYRTNTGAFIIEVGGGRGRANCWDALGNEYTSTFDVSLVLGAGAVAGACETRGRITAAGAGFAFRDVLGLLGQAELSSRHIGEHGVAGGVRIGSGVNVNLTLNSLRYGGNFCFGMGSIQGILTTNPTRLIRVPSRVGPPQTGYQRPLPPLREQREPGPYDRLEGEVLR